MPRTRAPHQASATLNRKQLDLIQFLPGHGRLSLVDRVVELVARQIESGKIAPGHRLPSVRQLAQDCEVSADTAARAYDKLVARNIIESRAGSGFYVRQPNRAQVFERDHRNNVLAGWWRLRLLQTDRPNLSTSGAGVLPADWIDEGGIGGALRTVARASQRGLAEYGDLQGYLPLRQQIQSKLKEIQVEVPPSQIMITQGATEALNLLIMGKLRTSQEYVLIDDPGSFLLRDRLMASGLIPASVPRQPDGPDLIALRALCEQHRPRYYFTCSVLNNPDSSITAPHKAFQLLRLAEEFDFTIVEDDTYGDLAPTSASVTRLATLDQLQRVIYIGSFSKTLAAGLRVGYMAANPEHIEWLTVYKAVSGISNCNLSQRMVYQLLSQGGYRHHCTQLRARLDQHRQVVADQLRQIGCSIEQVPDAGMYLWAKLPGGVNASTVAHEMHRAGHLTAPGELFGTPRHCSHMRFNIATTRDSPGLPLLAKLALELAT